MKGSQWAIVVVNANTTLHSFQFQTECSACVRTDCKKVISITVSNPDQNGNGMHLAIAFWQPPPPPNSSTYRCIFEGENFKPHKILSNQLWWWQQHHHQQQQQTNTHHILIPPLVCVWFCCAHRHLAMRVCATITDNFIWSKPYEYRLHGRALFVIRTNSKTTVVCM